jgi:hypothetical protein
MKTFRVSFPVSAWYEYDVEAETEQQALEIAWEKFSDGEDQDNIDYNFDNISKDSGYVEKFV